MKITRARLAVLTVIAGLVVVGVALFASQQIEAKQQTREASIAIAGGNAAVKSNETSDAASRVTRWALILGGLSAAAGILVLAATRDEANANVSLMASTQGTPLEPQFNNNNNNNNTEGNHIS